MKFVFAVIRMKSDRVRNVVKCCIDYYIFYLCSELFFDYYFCCRRDEARVPIDFSIFSFVSLSILVSKHDTWTNCAGDDDRERTINAYTVMSACAGERSIWKTSPPSRRKLSTQ